MKIVRAGALPVGGESGLLDIRDGRAEQGFGDSRATRRGAGEYDVWPAYVERVLSFVDVERDRAAARRHRRRERHGRGDAAAGPRAPADRRAPFYFEPDGTFPNHEPNPLLPENREFIVAPDARGGRRPRGRLRRRRRPLLLRRRHGRVRPGRLRHGAARRDRSSRRSPARRSSTTSARAGPSRRTIERAGRRPLVNRVGHAFIKHRMREEDALFAGEVSGHYYFRDFTQADSGVVPFLLMLELISDAARSCRSSSRRSASATSSRASSTRRSRTSR